MPRNGSGGYSPPQNSWNPAINGNQALPDDWIATLNDIAAALQASISADGQTPITGSLNFGNNRLRNVGAPQGQGDALRLDQMMKGADVPSAATIAFPVEGALFDVTGTTIITAIAGSFAGRIVLVRFTDALTLTNDANLILPGGADITTQAGDFAVLVCLDGTKWQCWLYPRLLSSDFYGPTAPTTTYAGMTWADSGTNTLWRRNATNDSWDYEHRILTDVTTDLQWLGTPIGSYITPKVAPPTDDPRFRYIVCTAGQTGSGGYNNGVLTSESVSGSDPTITATASVSLSGSAMNGTTIHLINTEGRFLRPGVSSGVLQDSQNLAHTHNMRFSQVLWSSGTGGVRIDPIGLLSTDSSGGTEARPRNISEVYYQRIL